MVKYLVLASLLAVGCNRGSSASGNDPGPSVDNPAPPFKRQPPTDWRGPNTPETPTTPTEEETPSGGDDLSNSGGGEDLSTSGPTDMGTGGSNDGGVPVCDNVVCPDGQTCNAGECIPVTPCQPGDAGCWHNGVCLPVEASFMTSLCHVPSGNPEARHEICVGNPAVPTHLGNGDYLGACLFN